MNSHSEPLSYDVAVVGSGPAGIGVAKALEGSDLNYIVLEREPYIGGIPMSCHHPSFGLSIYKYPMSGKKLIRRLTRQMDLSYFKTNTTVLSLNQLTDGEHHYALDLRDNHRCYSIKAKEVILATGCRETTRHAHLVSGLRPLEILTTGALQRVIDEKLTIPFKRPVIVGSELVGFSALMSLLTHKIKPVAMLESGNRLATWRVIALLSKILMIPIYYRATILKIHGVERVEGITLEIEKKGRKKQVFIPCDSLVFSGHFVSENTLIYDSHLENLLNETGCIDPLKLKEKDGLEAVGNIIHPGGRGDLCYLEGFQFGISMLERIN